MEQCLFLSTPAEPVQCFYECTLYNWTINQGECPFNYFAECTHSNGKRINDFEGEEEEDKFFLKSLQEMVIDK